MKSAVNRILDLLETTWQRGRAWRVGLAIAGAVLGWLMLELAALVWLGYAVLACMTLPRLADARKSWRHRAVWVLAAVAVIGFGSGRLMWFLWPSQLPLYIYFLDFAHYAMIAHVAVMLSLDNAHREQSPLDPSEDTNGPA
ncbi:hypothetical protein [Aurantiacibacter zhengii]|uniref:Uncharacterized protein n=1 Tax=Aurantiacibacter zhengii TaxID=2307003 RepID=A0A418NU29_9SPHN|nr:hypothetical protein [Aurantiacibacter zhengii]RIV87511.1 hypothetical protein D2V07_03935 [Aurantiacibacter zhengii]